MSDKSRSFREEDNLGIDYSNGDPNVNSFQPRLSAPTTNRVITRDTNHPDNVPGVTLT